MVAPETAPDGGGTYAAFTTKEGREDKLSAEEQELSDIHAAHVGAAKAASILMKIEKLGYIGVPADSCYGAAVAIPQVARSSGWATTYTGLALRCYVFLVVTFSLQLFLLSMIRIETGTMDNFSGKMHLCDFGKSIKRCPDAPNCRGPGGTEYTYPRLYDHTTWAIRSFVRDALADVFPDKSEEIHVQADPGEYGMENYYCRIVCVFIFMMSVVDDLKDTLTLVALLYKSPTANEMWITYGVPSWSSKDYVKKVRGWSELDLVTFKVAGMPMKWKVLNAVFVAAPKLFVWVTLCSTGFHFLMETSTIVDVIVNSVALKFILDLDGLILSHLATSATRYIIHNLESMELFDPATYENESEVEAKERFFKEEKDISGEWSSVYNLLFPKRLFIILALTGFFVVNYYLNNCDKLEDGSWVSKPMPTLDDHFVPSFSQLILGIRPPQSHDTFWTMPEPSD